MIIDLIVLMFASIVSAIIASVLVDAATAWMDLDQEDEED